MDVANTPCYGPPPQYSRRGSQEQMLSQRMKQMTIQAPQPVYQPDGAYCPPRSPFEHLPAQYPSPSGVDRGFYGPYYSQTAPPASSYANVVPRGEGKSAAGNLASTL